MNMTASTSTASIRINIWADINAAPVTHHADSWMHAAYIVDHNASEIASVSIEDLDSDNPKPVSNMTKTFATRYCQRQQ